MNMPESILVTIVSLISLALVFWGMLMALKKRAWLASVVLFSLLLAGILILFFHPLLFMHSGAILLASSGGMMAAYILSFKRDSMATAKVLFPFLLFLTSGQVLKVIEYPFNPWITLVPACLIFLWIQLERRQMDEDLFMETALLIMVTAFILF